ncbi:MAG: Asp23/Gls24 family envelope stress response protein [Eggerthellaceae bacterium]
MSEELYVDGLGLAPGVMETIVAIAAKEVEGVASVGASTFSGIRSRFVSNAASQGIEVSMNETEGVDIAVHIDVFYGRPIPPSRPMSARVLPTPLSPRSASKCRRWTCMSTASPA